MAGADNLFPLRGPSAVAWQFHGGWAACDRAWPEATRWSGFFILLKYPAGSERFGWDTRQPRNPSLDTRLNIRLPSLRPRILVLDHGSSHVAGGLFTTTAGGRLVLCRLVFETHRPGAAGETNWSEATCRALAGIAPGGISSLACRLALPGRRTLVKFVRTPLIGKSRPEHVMEFAARQNIPGELAQVEWGHLLVAEDGPDLEIMLAAIKCEDAAKIHNAAAAAGFRVTQMVPSSIAMRQAFHYSLPAERDSILVAEIGARSTHLLFIQGGRFFIRTLALGGDAVTQTMADELQIDFESAERLKIQVLTSGREAVRDPGVHVAVGKATASFAGRLHQEILRTTISYRGHSGAARPGIIHLAGGGSLLPGLPTILADQLAVRVVCFDPLSNVTLVPTARVLAEEAAPMLAGLVGLATSLIDEGWPALNLLPSAVGQARMARRRQSTLLAAAALAAAAPLPVIWHYHRVTAAAVRASAVIEARLVPARDLAMRNADNLAVIREAGRRINTLGDVVGARSNWIVFLNDLQDRMAHAADVWQERLQFNHPAGNGGKPPLSVVPRLTHNGRMLDDGSPGATSGAVSPGRVTGLLQLLGRSPFVSKIENEHFDHTQPGLLRFDCTLALDPHRPL